MSDIGLEQRLETAETGKQGNARMVVLLAGALISVSAAIVLLGRDDARPVILAMLSVLSVIGVFTAFAWAVGLVRFGERKATDGLPAAVIDALPTGALVTDRDGRIVLANEAYVKLTGANGPTEVPTVERVFAVGGDTAEPLHRLSQAAASGRRHSEEIGIEGEDGLSWYRVTVSGLGSGRRARQLVLWRTEDITEERRHQQRAFLELQRAVDDLDNAPVGFLSIDRGGKIRYLNATLARWLGHDLGDFDLAGLTTDDIVAGDGAHMLETPGSGEAIDGAEILDLDLLGADGRPFPVRLIHTVATGSDGRAMPSRTVVINRSPGSGDAEPLRAAEVRFARFFNNTPMGIATVDRDFRIGRTNASFARVFLTEQGGKTTSILDVIAKEDHDSVSDRVGRAAGGQADISPIDVHTSGDSARVVRLFPSPVEDRDGESAIVYALDVTEQKAMEEQVSQGTKLAAVGQLAAGIAHDFNNILTGIIGFSDLLLAQHQPTDPAFNNIIQIKQNAHRAASLVRQLMAFSRQQTLRPRVIALNEILADLAVLLRRLLEAKIEIKVERGRDLWPVKADLTQLERVIINLAVNARDAMPDGGQLTIRTSNVSADKVPALDQPLLPVEDLVCIEVADSGSGMSPDVVEKIFDPFFSTKDVGKGTGLGLSTVYGIIKQTGGHIFVESAVDEGTTFRIYLPREASAALEGDGSASGAGDETAKDLSGHGTVLLVEDEVSIRTFATQALSARGYDVLAAETGAEAVELMDAHDGDIDIVVSDVVMPEMDGPTLFRELRKRKPDIKMLFMSGYAEDAFRKNLDAEARFHFLPKPFNLPELAEAVKNVLDEDSNVREGGGAGTQGETGNTTT